MATKYTLSIAFRRVNSNYSSRCARSLGHQYLKLRLHVEIWVIFVLENVKILKEIPYLSVRALLWANTVNNSDSSGVTPICLPLVPAGWS